MKKNKKYKIDKYYQGDLGPKGDVGIKTSDFEDDFDVYEEKPKLYDYDNDIYDMAVSLDSFDNDCLDTHSYKEHYDQSFETKKNIKKEDSKSKSISHSISHDNIVGFDHVKSYYNANIEAEYKKKTQMIRHLTISCLLMVGCLSAISYLTFYDRASNVSSIYIDNKTGAVSDIQNLRQQIHEDTAVIVNKSIAEPANLIQKEEPKVVAPSIVNNYNFEQLNTGLTTLGYSLLAVLTAFMSFKGISLLGRSLRIKKEIKKSNALLTQFKTLMNSNNHQLETSQLISEQIILNNIFIERLSSNNNVVELIAINEKLKDTNSFINDHLIKNLKGE